MAERPSGAGERRDRKLEEAEDVALGGTPKAAPKPLPEAKSQTIGEALKSAYEAFRPRHNVNGKEQKKAPY